MEYTPHMATIQVVIDETLLRAADRAARRQKVNLDVHRMEEVCAALGFAMGCGD